MGLRLGLVKAKFGVVGEDSSIGVTASSCSFLGLAGRLLPPLTDLFSSALNGGGTRLVETEAVANPGTANAVGAAVLT